MAILSPAQIQDVLRSVGWPENLVVTVTAIALAESSGNTTAGNRRGEYSIGLLQINMQAHGTRFGTEQQLYDPYTNARAALTLYNERQRQFPNGIRAVGKWYTGANVGLTHWGAFTDGRYRQFLSQSQRAYNGGSIQPPPPVQTPRVIVNTNTQQTIVPNNPSVLDWWLSKPDNVSNELPDASKEEKSGAGYVIAALVVVALITR